MSTPLLYDVLFAWKCSSTHHKLALDALRHLKHDRAAAWRDLFLTHVEPYLDGSKAPDNKFKDFRNHVLHVEDNLWGGAVASTRTWYAKSVEAFKAKRWKEAVYNTGVMSHYFTDPWQPFHTGQSEAEGVVHRAAEWSIACAYQELQQIIEEDLGGYPQAKLPSGDDWLDQLVIHGARKAHMHYQASIDHYDLKLGVKNPPAGLDQELKDRLADIISQVVAHLACVMDRMFQDADVSPPATNISLLGVMSQMTVPIFWVTKKMKNAKDRAVVEAMYREFQQTGKVLKTLPDDDREVRRLYAEEVLQLPVEMLDEEPTGPIGQAFGTGAEPRRQPVPKPVAAVPETPKPKVVEDAAPASGLRYYLEPAMPVEKAASIGAKTAAQLEKVGITTVADLLAAEAESLAGRLANRHFDADVIRDWQRQARLMCEVPLLRGGDAQLLTACGIADRALLSQQVADELAGKLKAFAATPAGERILRGGKAPQKAEVAQWIAHAQGSRQQAAA